jgi:hypothetical protein
MLRLRNNSFLPLDHIDFKSSSQSLNLYRLLRRSCRGEHTDEIRRNQISQALLDGGRQLGRGS